MMVKFSMKSWNPEEKNEMLFSKKKTEENLAIQNAVLGEYMLQK